MNQCRDVHDVTAHVRARPAMFIRGRSLPELQTFLAGYATALHVYGLDEEPFEFTPGGPFTQWLQARHGWPRARRWAAAIEAHAAEEEPLTVFFRLLDTYRANATPLP